MQIIQSIPTLQAEGAVQSNMLETMEQSPCVLEGYLQFSRALTDGQLDTRMRERIALTVAQATLCEYSLAQHTFRARGLGLTDDEIIASRQARDADAKIAAALRFARDLIADGSGYSTVELKHAGYSGAEIIEIVANVGVNVFESYFNLVAKTEVDFPRVPLNAKAA
jgi:AhpD family alkylhydroperoxidase